MDERGFQPRSFAPVRVGDEFDVTIEAVGAKGDGIAKKEGFVLFVPGVQKGDNVRIRVTRVLRKVGFAEVVGGSSGEQASAEDAAEEASEEEGEAPEEAPKEAGEESQEEEAEEDSDDFGEEEKQ